MVWYLVIVCDPAHADDNQQRVYDEKNGKHVVYFLNIINLLSFQAWSRPMTSLKKTKCIHEKMSSLSLYVAQI